MPPMSKTQAAEFFRDLFNKRLEEDKEHLTPELQSLIDDYVDGVIYNIVDTIGEY